VEGAGRLLQAATVPHGQAMHVDPFKPTLKAPGTKRLKLDYDKSVSNFAFKFNLRGYSTGQTREALRATAR
jgi:hypothetical protein